ncbi:MAG: hypothetical protein ACF8MF_06640 [Phycisphaerales bacterium JB052]
MAAVYLHVTFCGEPVLHSYVGGSSTERALTKDHELKWGDVKAGCFMLAEISVHTASNILDCMGQLNIVRNKACDLSSVILEFSNILRSCPPMTGQDDVRVWLWKEL